MKKLIIMLAAGLLAQQVIQAQGTIQVSNLAQASAGGESVGDDSWLATEFITGGIDGSEFELDSIALAMTAASGNPSDFTVMLYTAAGSPSVPQYPGVSLGTLDGSANPSAADIYTFTPATPILLTAGTPYFIVLTAGTSVANGAYAWSFTGSRNPYTGSWTGDIVYEQSSDGASSSSSWLGTGYGAQYAITASVVPEPGELTLVAAGSLFFIWHRRKLQAVE